MDEDFLFAMLNEDIHDELVNEKDGDNYDYESMNSSDEETDNDCI